MLKNVFIPESYNIHNLTPNWSQYVLRPEFAESTWFLYKATGDKYYLNVAKNIIDSLEKYARVKCGYACIADIKNMRHLDQMDSYFLSEMFKYLYLIFNEGPSGSEIPFDIDDLEITTEAHWVPITNRNTHKKSTFIYKCQNVKESFADVATIRNAVRLWLVNQGYKEITDHEDSASFSMSSLYNFTDYMQKIMQDKNIEDSDGSGSGLFTVKISEVDNFGPKSDPKLQNLNEIDPNELDTTNTKQLEDLSRMGITILTSKNGQIQLFHNPDSAESIQAGLLGQDFMVKIVKLNQEMQEKLSSGDEAFESKHIMAINRAEFMEIGLVKEHDVSKIDFIMSQPASPALFVLGGVSELNNPVKK